MDEAHLYFKELLSQGYVRRDAITYTKTHFPDFIPNRFFRKSVMISLVLMMLMSTGGYYILRNSNDDVITQDKKDEDEVGDDAENGLNLYYITSQDDLPDCDSNNLNQLYYVVNDTGFQTCTDDGWSFVDLAGPSSSNESSDNNGSDGNDGAPGEKGEQGNPGAAGHSALAVTNIEPAGINCVDGGIRIRVGIDLDDDDFLDASEVEHTQFVCNGVDGQDGQNGTDGSASPETMLTRISTPSIQECSSGGRIMEQGLDNGDDGGNAQNSVLEDGEVDYITTYCSNYLVTRLADINSGDDSSSPGSYTGLVVVGNTIYFDAHEPTYGTELWAHETDSGSTLIAANIHSGFYSSAPGGRTGIIVVDNTLYFDAWTGSTELWAYETTNSTAWQAADIYPGSAGSAPGFWGRMVKVGTTLYFDAMDDTTGSELWAHDAASGTTWQVADINSGTDSSAPGYYTGINVIGTILYFCATDGISGYELWSHDTVAGTTEQVTDIYSGSESSIPGKLSGLTMVGTTLYFDADDGINGRELWAHDTITEATWQVEDIRTGSSDSDPGDNAGLTVVGNILYFDAFETTFGRELWAHDTLSGSTWRATDIYTGSEGSYPGFNAGEFALIGAVLYFDALDDINGRELWAHDTTTGVSWLVSDINSGGTGSKPGDNAGFSIIDSRLFFDAEDVDGAELWVHDTTTGATWQVADINSSGSSDPGRLTGLMMIGSRLYFQANDGSGFELWMMDIEHSISYY